jgi:hypothetical protein
MNLSASSLLCDFGTITCLLHRLQDTSFSSQTSLYPCGFRLSHIPRQCVTRQGKGLQARTCASRLGLFGPPMCDKTGGKGLYV